MATTTLHDWVTPEGTASPNVTVDLDSLAEQIDSDVPVVQVAAPAHKNGRYWWTGSRLYISDGTKWFMQGIISDLVTYDSVNAKLAQNNTVIPVTNLPALPGKTRCTLIGEGVAGFDDVALAVGMYLSATGTGVTLTQRTTQAPNVVGAKWCEIGCIGSLVIPANTAATIKTIAQVTGGTAYYRVGLSIIREGIA